jgi:hypothetical protein
MQKRITAEEKNDAKKSNEIPLFFFLSRKKDKNSEEYIIYGTERYRLTEYDLLSMIKILLVDRRLIGVGRKLLWVYEDTHEYSEKAYRRLKEIGLKVDKEGVQTISQKKSNILGVVTI